MKTIGSITPIQSYQSTPSASDSSLKTPMDAEGMRRFGAPKALHPANSAISPANEILAGFRDTNRLASHANQRTESLHALQQLVMNQFGSGIARTIFNS